MEWKKYRKKPVVINAEQWFEVTYDREAGHGIEEKDSPIYHLSVGYYRTPDLDGKNKCKNCQDIMHNHGWIDTLEGGHIVCPNDWIIEGIKGELYPCKPDIFQETYNEVILSNLKCAKCSEFLEENKRTRLVHTPIENTSMDFEAPCYECWNCKTIIFSEEDSDEIFDSFDKAYREKFPKADVTTKVSK